MVTKKKKKPDLVPNADISMSYPASAGPQEMDIERNVGGKQQ